MRRPQAETLGIHLPVLPTLVLGGLPGDPTWAGELRTIGVDVVASGATRDTADTVAAALAAAQGRPVKAVAGDPAELVRAGARIIEGGGTGLIGAYGLAPDEKVVPVVDGSSPEVEDPNVVARLVVEAVAHAPAAGLWVVATPGMDRLDADTAAAKLRALCETAFQARMAIAKVQFDLP